MTGNLGVKLPQSVHVIFKENKRLVKPNNAYNTCSKIQKFHGTHK